MGFLVLLFEMDHILAKDITSSVTTSSIPGNRNDSGALLRLFQSDFFDAGVLCHYLFQAARQGSSGVVDYLCNQVRGHKRCALLMVC